MLKISWCARVNPVSNIKQSTVAHLDISFHDLGIGGGRHESKQAKKAS